MRGNNTGLIIAMGAFVVLAMCAAIVLAVAIFSFGNIGRGGPSAGANPTQARNFGGGGESTGGNTTGDTGATTNESGSTTISGGAQSQQATAFVPNTSASSFLPTVSGYTSSESASVSGALAAAGRTGVDLFASGVVEFAVEQVDDFIGCYSQAGAVSARVYVSTADLLSGDVPPVGAVAVVNQSRVIDSLLACTIGGGSGSGLFSAQSASGPCGSAGDFIANGERIGYVYAATDQRFCDVVAAHFGRYGG